MTIDRSVTPWTYSADATIEVGDNSYLNGTRFGCKSLIRIGANAIISDASIMDTDFHSIYANRKSPDAVVRTQPVLIEDNVWVAAAVGILPGTTIGRNSVVGYGAVCAGNYPSDAIIAGNPARVTKSIPIVDSS